MASKLKICLGLALLLVTALIVNMNRSVSTHQSSEAGAEEQHVSITPSPKTVSALAQKIKQSEKGKKRAPETADSATNMELVELNCRALELFRSENIEKLTSYTLERYPLRNKETERKYRAYSEEELKRKVRQGDRVAVDILGQKMMFRDVSESSLTVDAMERAQDWFFEAVVVGSMASHHAASVNARRLSRKHLEQNDYEKALEYRIDAIAWNLSHRMRMLPPGDQAVNGLSDKSIHQAFLELFPADRNTLDVKALEQKAQERARELVRTISDERVYRGLSSLNEYDRKPARFTLLNELSEAIEKLGLDDVEQELLILQRLEECQIPTPEML